MNMTELFQQLKIDEDLWPFMEHYHDWLIENIEQIHASEMILVSPDGYAGTTDMHAKLRANGKDAIVDYKTQNVRSKPVFYDKFVEQLVAYRNCFPNASAMECVSVVIDSNQPAPCVQKKWSKKEVAAAETVFNASLQIWQASKKYKPEGGEE